MAPAAGLVWQLRVPGRSWRGAASGGRAPGAPVELNVMASFSCCRLRQGEGDHAGVRVAQAQPARRPSHLKRPGTEPRLVAGRCSKVKVLIAVPQRKGNVSEGRAAPVDGSDASDEQSPGR